MRRHERPKRASILTGGDRPSGDSSSRAPVSEPPQAKRSSVDSQKRILDGAEQEFARSGFAGARLREIAASAQVQTALIHHYFTDKRGLYEEVIRRALDQMSIASFRVLGEGRDLRGYLRGFVDLLVDFYEANQNLLAIMRAEAHSESGIFMTVVREKTGPILDAVLAMTEALMERGEIRRDLEAKEILIGGLSLILYPIVDAPILQAVFPEASRAGKQATGASKQAAARERRKIAITEMLLGAVRPLSDAAPTSPPQKATRRVTRKR
jgi:TetR/AcrR family transcriptional regulator